MSMDVIFPEMLFRKLGSPCAKMSESVDSEGLTRTKRSARRPLMNGQAQMMHAMLMPRLVPRAAKVMPRSRTYRNMNSNSRHSRDMTMFITIEKRTRPHILR